MPTGTCWPFFPHVHPPSVNFRSFPTMVTFVITSGPGNIDLSVPSVLTLSAYVSMSAMAGEDSAPSTMTGNWRISSPLTVESPASQKSRTACTMAASGDGGAATPLLSVKGAGAVDGLVKAR